MGKSESRVNKKENGILILLPIDLNTPEWLWILHSEN